MNDKQLAQEKLNKLIKEVEQLKAIINEPNKTKEERFFELIQGLTPKWDRKRYPTSIFYFKGDKFILKYNQKSRFVWVSYYSFWSIFEEEYNLNYQKVKEFLKGMLEEYFKWNRVVPHQVSRRTRTQLEEHFKWKEGNEFN